MASSTINCKSIRNWLCEKLNSRLGINAEWIQTHVAQCPRCRRRLSGFNRVLLGFHLIKTIPHRLDLLLRANQQAINVLQRSVRDIPQADKLRRMELKPTRFGRLAKYGSSVGNAAACLGVLLLLKMGIFSSMEKIQSQGTETIRNYYAKNAGQDLSDEIFLA